MYKGCDFVKIFLCFVLAVFFLTGCKAENIQNNVSYPRREEFTLSAFKSDETRALEIKNAIEKIDGVNSAAVAVVGKTALIGLKTDYEEFDDIRRLKELVEVCTRLKDGEILNTAISTDSQIYARIEQLNN